MRLNKVEAGRTLESTSHETHQKNLFGVINAVTRAGQLDCQGWVRMDEIGGQLMNLTDNRWDRIKTVAGTMTDKDYERAFVLSA